MQNGLVFLGLRRWPVRTEIRVGMLLRPAVENLGECGCLSTSCGQVLLEHEYEHEVAFGGEVHDVLGHNRPARPPGGRGYVCVFGCPETKSRLREPRHGHRSRAEAQRQLRGTFHRSESRSRQQCLTLLRGEAASLCHCPVTVDPHAYFICMIGGVIKSDA